MPDSGWIAVDAMGGDDGLAVMLAGVALARHQFEGQVMVGGVVAHDLLPEVGFFYRTRGQRGSVALPPPRSGRKGVLTPPPDCAIPHP